LICHVIFSPPVLGTEKIAIRMPNPRQTSQELERKFDEKRTEKRKNKAIRKTYRFNRPLIDSNRYEKITKI